MRKRFLCLFTLFAFTAMVFTSCSVKVTEANAKEILAAAILKTSTAKSFTGTIESNLSTSILGQSITAKSTGMVAMSNIDIDSSEALEAQIVMDINSNFTKNSTPQSISIYVKNNTVYIAALDQQYKSSLASDSADSNLIDQYAISKQLISSDMIESYAFAQTDDGIIYDLALNDESLSEFLNNTVLSSFNNESLGLNYDDITLAFDNPSITLVVKNGYIVEQNILLTMVVTALGTSINLDIDFSSRFENLNKPVTIDFPDFSNYKEME